jgi:hypothetical protein
MALKNAKWVGYSITTAVAAVIAGALWIVFSAALENMKFAAGSEQILNLVSSLRDLGRDTPSTFNATDDLLLFASKNKRFDGIETNVSPAVLQNPWGRLMTAKLAGPWTVQLETSVPHNICNRLVAFTYENALSIGLRTVEARNDLSTPARLIYRTDGKTKKMLSGDAIRAGCGAEELSFVRLTFAMQ